ncbi:MAG TPA: ABC transporter permease [Actinomycetes bacterium]|nr:ABC transporter permease [Actinomycetes bacterium]
MALLLADAPPNPWFSWTYVQDNADTLLAATREHVLLTAASVLGAVVIGLPLALVAFRLPATRPVILSVGGILYTIPALALMTLLWPRFGLSPTSVVIALVLYGVLIIIRNILTGLDDVPDDVIEAARGMGYGQQRLLWQVQLPLALPSIVAGVRIATVSTIGLVTIGSLLGYGGLGNLILGGFVNNAYHAQIMTATILVVVLAVIADLILVVVQRLLAPWLRKAQP